MWPFGGESASVSSVFDHQKLRGTTDLNAIPPTLTLKMITDLDKQSKVASASKPTFYAVLKTAKLYHTGKSPSLSPSNGDMVQDVGTFEIQFPSSEEGEVRIESEYNEGGRGMELSELIQFNNALYTVDDRTGIVFQIDEAGHRVIPKFIVSEGGSSSKKGMKLEWGTVKDGKMLVGSMGKEYTNPDGSIASYGSLWVSSLDSSGQVSHENWSNKYNALRSATATSFPGYLLHEAIRWSDIYNCFVVLPRRESTEPYNEDLDEKMGTNLVIFASEDFSRILVFRVGTKTPLRGHSSFQFIPGSKHQVIASLKSAEIAETDEQKTYLSIMQLPSVQFVQQTMKGMVGQKGALQAQIFTLEESKSKGGRMLVDEQEIPLHAKFEGIEVFY
jgi:soluble calcium-activated nucleotidase 1